MRDGWRDILADPTAHLHLYGKGEARPGRKMGHVDAADRLPDRDRRSSRPGLAQRLRRLDHLDRQAEPLELRPDLGGVADHHPDQLAADRSPARAAWSSACAVMPR